MKLQERYKKAVDEFVKELEKDHHNEIESRWA